MVAAGLAAVRAAIERGRAQQRLSDDEVAWLGLLLRLERVRDGAWWSITDPVPHVALWTDVLRRVEPSLAAPPACLLAFAAWRAGDGALAAVALDRAHDADPTYPMARLLSDALRSGIPPSLLDGWPDVIPGMRRRGATGQVQSTIRSGRA